MNANTAANLAKVLAGFKLTPQQREAAAERSCDLAVTAGAGSGKTSTLVARYVGLLCEGLAPAQVAAITFTEKAAREMRGRAREALRRLAADAADASELERWAGLEAAMDGARIGTIHSLCAEILRAHPAEAGVDPQFAVLDATEAERVRAAAVESALAWAVDQPDMRSLFDSFRIHSLQEMLAGLLASRLDVNANAFDPARCQARIRRSLETFMEDDQVQDATAELREMQSAGQLLALGGDKLAAQVAELLARMEEARSTLQAGRVIECAAALYKARRESMKGNIGKQGPVKQAVSDLKLRYDALLDGWLGGSDANDVPPNPDGEAVLLTVAPLVGRLLERAVSGYRAALDERRSLDFDDLEAGALRLLNMPRVAARWQDAVRAVLVDEFQDTNDRQRGIVEALSGTNPDGHGASGRVGGRLFVVGDARQSIYRFRGADVTVFTGLRGAIIARGGRAVELDRTFRAHPALLNAAGSLLRGVMSDQANPDKPFAIPYAPLVSDRIGPDANWRAPYIECLIGEGEDTGQGRAVAARALVNRLIEMHRAGEIQQWDQVALLFRASTAFPVYEEALETGGVPFVTVAGSGFYDRPEVRDLLNMLRSLADPWDDQALAGVLRSPAFAVSDRGLYSLRCADNAAGRVRYRPLRQALAAHLDVLDEPDRGQALRALNILQSLDPWVDRLPVAELLRRVVEATGYRAVLAAAGSRLWRNVDKLLSDARASGLVRVRTFLEYLETLREVGAREGEASSEAEGAVRLMTIHKSKGLQFPLVVLADASYTGPRGGSARERARPLDDAWTVYPDRLDTRPLAYSMAGWLDKEQSEAETARLLYVALTRASDKLLISGHITQKSRVGEGWLKSLLAVGDVATGYISEGQPVEREIPGGGVWRLSRHAPGTAAARLDQGELQPAGPRETVSQLLPLYPPLTWDQLARPAAERRSASLPGPSELALAALRRWRLAGQVETERMLVSIARQAGYVEEGRLREAVRSALALLDNLSRHPLWQEIQSAAQVRRNVPFSLPGGSGEGHFGTLDALYRQGDRWKAVVFAALSTTEPENEDLTAARRAWQPAHAALAHWLGAPVAFVLVRLDEREKVLVEQL